MNETILIACFVITNLTWASIAWMQESKVNLYKSQSNKWFNLYNELWEAWKSERINSDNKVNTSEEK